MVRRFIAFVGDFEAPHSEAAFFDAVGRAANEHGVTAAFIDPELVAQSVHEALLPPDDMPQPARPSFLSTTLDHPAAFLPWLPRP